MYNWVALLYSRDRHSSINQLHFNKIKFKKIKNQAFKHDKLIKIKMNNSCNTNLLDAENHDLCCKTMKMSIFLYYAPLPRAEVPTF